MQRMMNRLIERINKVSVSKKISITYSLFFLLLMLAVASFMLINAWMYYVRASRNELEETAEKVVEYIEAGGSIDADKIDELNPNKTVKVVVSERGTGVKNHINSHGFPPPEFDLKQEDKQSPYKTGRFNDQQYMYTMRVAHYEGRDFSVQVFRSQNGEIEVMQIFALIFFVIIFLAAFVSVKTGRFISDKMLEPIREMTKTVDKITAEDLSRRVELPAAEDEFRSLAETFNNMFDRLENSFEKQKQFVSDASHELRTPISVIQGYANLIGRWGKSDEEVLNESIESIKSETEHMNILINQLLFLAREDRADNAINLERFNLWELLGEAVAETNLTCDREEAQCFLEGDEAVWIKADSHLIKQTVRIIIENAVKYAKNKPAVIRLTLKRENGRVLLDIADNGIGIPKEDLEHIFDRFFRSDKSRNKQITGNGLGLSIAYSIIKNHGGRLWAESEAGEGSVFHIELNLDEN